MAGETQGRAAEIFVTAGSGSLVDRHSLSRSGGRGRVRLIEGRVVGGLTAGLVK